MPSRSARSGPGRPAECVSCRSVGAKRQSRAPYVRRGDERSRVLRSAAFRPVRGWRGDMPPPLRPAALTGCVPIRLTVSPGQADSRCVGSPTDLTDEQWALLEPFLNVGGKRGRKFSADIRSVVDGCVLHHSHRVPMAVFAIRVRSVDASMVPVPALVAQRCFVSALGRGAPPGAGTPRPRRRRASMVVIDTHLARGASNGGVPPSTTGAGRTGPRRGPSGPWPSTSPGCRWPLPCYRPRPTRT